MIPTINVPSMTVAFCKTCGGTVLASGTCTFPIEHVAADGSIHRSPPAGTDIDLIVVADAVDIRTYGGTDGWHAHLGTKYAGLIKPGADLEVA